MDEFKKKPDYWYNQSAVIPFRKNNGKIEILIITTRKKKWIFPKGIIDIGLTAKQSAQKEALEEAGIRGELLTNNLGSYSYKKWGGKCKVRVYALKVNLVLDEWEENFRDRKWIEITLIKEYIFNDKLIHMVNNLNGLLAKNEKT